MASISFKIEGEAELISFGVDAFVRNHGWVDGSEVSKEDFARNIIRGFIRESVAAYVSAQAQKTAKEQALAQTIATMNQLTSTIELAQEEP